MNNRIPAECFPPGEFLSDELNARQVSVSDFARVVGMAVQDVCDILNGNKHIGIYEAERLGSALGVSSAFWVNAQKSYDEWLASRKDAADKRTASLNYKYTPGIGHYKDCPVCVGECVCG